MSYIMSHIISYIASLGFKGTNPNRNCITPYVSNLMRYHTIGFKSTNPNRNCITPYASNLMRSYLIAMINQVLVKTEIM